MFQRGTFDFVNEEKQLLGEQLEAQSKLIDQLEE